LAEEPVLQLHRRYWMAIDALAIAGLIFFALYFLTAFRFDTLFTVEARQVDFTIWRFVPSYIMEHGRYPAVVTGDWIHTIFPYLPSAAAMMLPLSIPPQTVGFAIWLLIESIAFLLVILTSLHLSGAMQLRGRMLIAIGAVLLCGNSLGWDFRTHNTNIVYLALVMLGLVTRRIWLAALLLALSFNLKLYSGPLMLALAWRREYRLAVGTALAAAAIAVLLPMLVFGLSAFPQLISDWLAQIHYTLSPVTQSAATASLYRSAATLLAAEPSSNEVITAVRITQLTWIFFVVGYFMIAGRSQPLQQLAYSQARLGDICVALMAPLPLSTWLITYHAVVMLPAFMLLIVIAADSRWPNWLRCTAIASCVGCQVIRFTVRDYDYRGASLVGSCLLILLALIPIRRSLAKSSQNESRL
jgi:hypothetical protein